MNDDTLFFWYNYQKKIESATGFFICDKISLKRPLKKKVDFKISAILKYKTEFQN